MEKRIPYYRIEAYLAGVLSNDERVSFEIEMGEDAVLAEVVVEQRGIVLLNHIKGLKLLGKTSKIFYLSKWFKKDFQL